MKLKRCSKCGKRKPLSEFRPNARYADGYTSQCAECYRTYWRDWAKSPRGKKVRSTWREAHREKVLARARERYHEKKEAQVR